MNVVASACKIFKLVSSQGLVSLPAPVANDRANRKRKSILLIAPTGAGKTLSGFLPSLIDLTENPHQELHTLYLSPIKALAVDIARNLDTPISEMGLPITVETRTGDTPQAKRNRQRTTAKYVNDHARIT